MTVLKVARLLEINFWNLLILLLQEEGPVMQFVQGLKRMTGTKAGLLIVLIAVWSAVGFLMGMVLGRIIWMLQLI